jgi:zinc transport system substrate-binding protein
VGAGGGNVVGSGHVLPPALDRHAAPSIHSSLPGTRIVLILGKETSMSFRIARAALVVSAVMTTAVACNSTEAPETEELTVVASFYPLAEAAEIVGGDAVAVQNLTPPGVEPHDLELAPDDLEALVTADVVLYLGGGFQPAVEEGVEQAEGSAVDVLEVVGTLLPPTEGEEGEDLAADPHVWLDPRRYSAIVGAIEQALADAAPAAAPRIRSNAEGYRSELAILDGEFSEGLADCERRTIVTNHAAFGYLAEAYDLDQVAISGLEPDAETDPARLAELRALVVQQGITTIFTEELVSPEVAETLAEEAGVGTAVLNTLEGLTQEQLEANEDYGSVMRDNLDTLRNALSCT